MGKTFRNLSYHLLALIRVFDGLTLCNDYTDESVPMGTIAELNIEADGTVWDGQSKNDPLGK